MYGKINIETRDIYGTAPLMFAAKRVRNTELIKLFIENGAKVKSKDNLNRTPLHYACGLFSNEKVAELLIDKGA